jgi:hypothetical protein
MSVTVDVDVVALDADERRALFSLGAGEAAQ